MGNEGSSSRDSDDRSGGSGSGTAGSKNPEEPLRSVSNLCDKTFGSKQEDREKGNFNS